MSTGLNSAKLQLCNKLQDTACSAITNTLHSPAGLLAEYCKIVLMHCDFLTKQLMQFKK